MKIRVDFRHEDTSIRILSHGYAGRYWIKLWRSKDIMPVGVKVKMYVAHHLQVPRHRYLHRVNLDTISMYGQELYGDSEDDKELLDKCVDMTQVSPVCQLIASSAMLTMYLTGKEECRGQGVRHVIQ
jgi:hypothetical protein